MADRTPRTCSPESAPPDPRDLAPGDPVHGLVPGEPVHEDEIEDALGPPYDPDTYDPSEFEWRPVPRRPRADGWTPDVQRSFIQALADTGIVEEAARTVNMSVQSAYRLRRAPGSAGFARAWEAALACAAERVLDLAFTRAIQGEDVPVFDRDGNRIGAKWRTSDRLTMFILRAYMPDRFRHAHESLRSPAEAPPPALPPLADAMAALGPPVPAAPHLSAPNGRMAALIDGARGRARVEALYPLDAREPYVRPRVEEGHPVAVERRRQRAEREAAREDREAERKRRAGRRRGKDGADLP